MKNIWILIYVHRGLIQEPEIFFEFETAQKRKAIIMSDFNPDYDEIDIFEKVIFL
jgi:hypothetical protein